jgi:glycosyltransferase involved in cell wall biosynthesis
VNDVSVAMATHNGARFLREQLESISLQTYSPAELVISDDASTDDTVKIAEEFGRSARFPVHVHVNEQAVGAGENFMLAAGLCQAPLVSFSDQDDVWLPAKLERCVSLFADSQVQLVVHGWTVVDDRLQELEVHAPSPGVVVPPLAPKWGQWPGMAMVFSRRLIDRFDWESRPDAHEERPLLHDEWIYGLARVAGKIAFVPESLCLYRQHPGNVEGAPDVRARRRLELAVTTGHDYYLRRAAQARGWASLWRPAAREIPRAASEAESYARLAKALDARAAVYGRDGGPRSVWHALRDGAYRSRKREGFGARGLARDLLLTALRRAR